MTGWRHPCDQHPTWCHTEECLASPCGFCGRDLDETPSGECRTCGRIVCEECDGGYDLALGGAICRPCAGITTRGIRV